MTDSWRVSSQEKGMSLLGFLKQKRHQLSGKALKRAIDNKCCTVNGCIQVISTYSLKKDDQIAFTERRPKRPNYLPILYEDEDLIIVDKPPGLISETRLFSALLKKNVQLIHRLDKETSGVLMLGKNATILKEMIALFRKREIHKEYLALVDGSIAHSQGVIENTLVRRLRHGQPLFVNREMKKGNEAITHWRCVQKMQTATLVLCEPITGRTHQLRAHLSGMGHPVLGDVHYAKCFYCSFRSPRHLLHSSLISFIYPKTNALLQVTSPLPPDFKEAIAAVS